MSGNGQEKKKKLKQANLIIKHIIGSFHSAVKEEGAIKSHKALFGLINFSGIINSLSFAGFIHIFFRSFLLHLGSELEKSCEAKSNTKDINLDLKLLNNSIFVLYLQHYFDCGARSFHRCYRNRNKKKINPARFDEIY